jgi:FkbM family methyltransferase
MAGNSRDVIQRYVYLFGVWEPHLTDWLASRLRRGDVFIDVGANIGYYTLLGSALVGAEGGVVAIEAARSIAADLQANVSRNGIQNVRVVNMAASDSVGRVQLFGGPAQNRGATSTMNTLGLPPEGEVDSAPLSSILQPAEIRGARVIKIDVEGAEFAVVAGMEPIIASSRDDLEIIVEVDPRTRRGSDQSIEGLIDRFLKWGFHPYASPVGYGTKDVLEAPKRPVRLRDAVRKEANLVFSRVDAEYL